MKLSGSYTVQGKTGVDAVKVAEDKWMNDIRINLEGICEVVRFSIYQVAGSFTPFIEEGPCFDVYFLLELPGLDLEIDGEKFKELEEVMMTKLRRYIEIY